MKTELDQLADRHLRADPTGVLSDGTGRPGSVRVSISLAMASTRGGQHLVWMLVNLLCRQFKVVQEIILDVPDTPLLPDVAAYGQCSTLRGTLLECARMVSGMHTLTSIYPAAGTPDATLHIGQQTEVLERHWCLYADGWRYCVCTNNQVPETAPRSNLTLGPYMCAAYAAGEVFKSFRGMKPGKGTFIQDHYATCWTMSSANSWGELAEGPGVAEIPQLPHFYFAGAGAVAQAAALSLGLSGLRGACTAVDQDELDLTNDNRYVLSYKAIDGASKVAVMRDFLNKNGFKCTPVPHWWQEFVASSGRHSHSDEVRELEQNYRFPIVLSCVDKNPSRHELQNALPQLMIGGSTHGLTAKASIFDLGNKTACLKCHNPLPSRNGIVEARINLLRSMTCEKRQQYLQEHDLDEDTVARFLAPHACGKLSEADITRFAADSPEMSVGFVSIAAGVLLAAQFLRVVAVGSAGAIRDGAMAVAAFARPSLRPLHVGPDSSCNCSTALASRWTRMWQEHGSSMNRP